MKKLLRKLFRAPVIQVFQFWPTASSGDYYKIQGHYGFSLCRSGVASALKLKHEALPLRFSLLVSSIYFEGSTKIYVSRSVFTDMIRIKDEWRSGYSAANIPESLIDKLKLRRFAGLYRAYYVSLIPIQP